jgi:hypothetical protein
VSDDDFERAGQDRAEFERWFADICELGLWAPIGDTDGTGRYGLRLPPISRCSTDDRQAYRAHALLRWRILSGAAATDFEVGQPAAELDHDLKRLDDDGKGES